MGMVSQSTTMHESAVGEVFGARGRDRSKGIALAACCQFATAAPRAHAVDAQQPPTIVMIHGMWGGGWYWENFQGYFDSLGYRCLAPTLRHHNLRPGAPPAPGLATTSLLDYVADLEKEIASLRCAPILMGHSMGALLAQILASRHTPRALVLLTPAAPAGINSLTPSVLRSFRSALWKWGFWHKPLCQTFGEASYSMFHRVPVDQRQEIFARFVPESGTAATEIGFWFLDRAGAARVDAARVTCPVLVVGAGDDRITPVSIARKIARKYARVSTFKAFADHAHWVVAEPGWRDVAGYVGDWLRPIVSTHAKVSNPGA